MSPDRSGLPVKDMCRHHCFPNAVRPASGDATLAGPPRSPFHSARIPEEQPGCRFWSLPTGVDPRATLPLRPGRIRQQNDYSGLRARTRRHRRAPRRKPTADNRFHVCSASHWPTAAITLTHEVFSADDLLDRPACGHVGNCRTDENETESSQRYNQPRRKRYEENDHEHRDGNKEQTSRGAERMRSHTHQANAEIDGMERLTG